MNVENEGFPSRNVIICDVYSLRPQFFKHWWSINLYFSRCQGSVRVGTGQVLVSWSLQLLEPPLSCPADRYRLRGGGRSTVLWEGLREVLRAALRQMRKRYHAGECYMETEISLWWNFHHCLHRKLSLWQLSVQPVVEISSKWYFRFNVIVSFHKSHEVFRFRQSHDTNAEYSPSIALQDWWLVDSHHKGVVMQNIFICHDVTMILGSLQECVNALKDTFHPECFLCFHCGAQIGSGSFHVEDGKNYCEKGNCSKQQIQK